MVKVLNKRGTRSEINSAATANGLNAGEVYLITDENRIAMGTSANTYESYAKESEAGGGGGAGTVSSVALTVPSFLSVANSPITTSGSLDITLSGIALPVANGGTGATTLAEAGIPVTTVANTFTGTQTFSGTSTTLAAILTNAAEKTTVSATSAAGTIAYYTASQSVLYYTSNASANWTLNIRHSAGTTLNTAMATGQCITVVHMVTIGTNAFYNSVVQVDGTTVTVKWQNGITPTTGDTNSIDAYTYTIIKTAAATFTVIASVTKYA